MSPDMAFITRPTEEQKARKNSTQSAHQQAFATYADQRSFIPVRNASLPLVSAGNTNLSECQAAANAEYIAADVIFDTAFVVSLR
jgi:hypothetical protein